MVREPIGRFHRSIWPWEKDFLDGKPQIMQPLKMAYRVGGGDIRGLLHPQCCQCSGQNTPDDIIARENFPPSFGNLHAVSNEDKSDFERRLMRSDLTLWLRTMSASSRCSTIWKTSSRGRADNVIVFMQVSTCHERIVGVLLHCPFLKFMQPELQLATFPLNRSIARV